MKWHIRLQEIKGRIRNGRDILVLMVVFSIIISSAVFLREILWEAKIPSHALLIAILVFAYAQYFSQQMTYFHNSRNADTNIMINVINYRNSGNDRYKESAKVWLTVSEHNRRASRLNSYSTIILFLSFWLLMIGLIVSILTNKGIFIYTFPVAINCLILALYINKKEIGYQSANKFLDKIFPLNILRVPKRWTRVDGTIHETEWLADWISELERRPDYMK